MKIDDIEFRKKLKRYNLPFHARELTFSCYRRYHYFNDIITCWIFLDFLGNARSKYGFKLWAYVMMPDHAHLLIYPGQNGQLVPKALHSLKGQAGR